MLQGSDSPATLSVSPSFHLFSFSSTFHVSFKTKKVFCTRRAAEAVQADRHDTRMQTIYGNPGVLSPSQFSLFFFF